MTLQVLGMICETIGGIAIAYTVFRVHEKLLEEKKVDQYVFQAIKIEQVIVIVGIIFMIVGFILQIVAQ